MCGRYTLIKTGQIPDFFEISDVRLPPRFNIAPTQEVPVVLDRAESRELGLMRWGLVPSWARDSSMGSRMINARVETVDQKPSFKFPFKSRRCLVPADGFFEWKREGGIKQPYYFTMRQRGLFAFAGLWDQNSKSEETLETFTILTCEANELVKPVHPRMPVILPRELYNSWLDPGRSGLELKNALTPFPVEEMEAFPVSRTVNSPANDSLECIEPVNP